MKEALNICRQHIQICVLFLSISIIMLAFKQTGTIIKYNISLSSTYMIICVMIMLLSRSVNVYKVQLADIFYLIMLCFTLFVFYVCYDVRINLTPIKSVAYGTLVYFFFRGFFSSKVADQKLPDMLVLFGSITMTVIIFIHFYYSLGITTINGFLLNGTLYSNFIALTFPFWFYVKNKFSDNKSINTSLNILIALCSMIILLNGARVATLVCILSFFVHLSIVQKLSKRYYVLLCLSVILIAGVQLNIKQGSSLGRLLIWKISVKVIKDHPLGVGIGNFPRYYNRAQSKYLNGSEVNKSELLKADVDEYAFNDIIQIAVESGVLVSIIYAALLVFLFVRTKNRYGKLLIFSWLLLSLFSYPLYIFILNFVFNIQAAYFTTRYARPEVYYGSGKWTKKILVLLLSIIFVFESINLYTRLTWRELHGTQYKTFDSVPGYIKNKLLNDNSFIYSLGIRMLLNKRHQEALGILKNSSNYTFDSDLNISIAICYEKFDIKKAEKYYLNACFINPGRFFPKSYLLDFYLRHDKDKAKNVAKDILQTPVKINSFFIDSLKNESSRILFNKNHTL